MLSRFWQIYWAPLLLGIVVVLWLIALALFFGPTNQPPTYGYSGEQSYQERFASLGIVLLSFAGWIGRNSAEIAAALTALATVAIARFTYTLQQSTGRLWEAGEKQYELAKSSIDLTRKSIDLQTKEFISTHRPRLRVRRFIPRLCDGSPVAVSFIVVNVGAGTAHMKEFGVAIGLQTTGGVSYEPTVTPMELLSLKGGEAALFISVAPECLYLDEWGITRNVQGPSFEFRGEIEYADDNGLIRRTRFWRVRDLQGRMRKRDDPDSDHEYED
jgi:hypothetical protein